MKKVLVLLMCIFFLVGCGRKEDTFELTIDINPSIKITYVDDVVDKVSALSKDADKIVDRKMNGKTMDTVFDSLFKNVKDKGLVEDDSLTIILGMEESDKMVEDKIRKACENNGIHVNTITPKITDEAKEEASNYKITAAKAAYILEIIKDNDKLKFKDLIDKDSRELNEMKETEYYCDNGYTLRNGHCEKKDKEEKPKEGKKCPEGYEEIKNKCYEIGITNHKPICPEGMSLKEGKCIGKEEVAASATCSKGTYNSSSKKCEITTFVSEGIADEDGNVTCPPGSTLTPGKGCYSHTSINPTYTCSEGTLEGDKCVNETTKDPELKVSCGKGLSNYKNRACIDYKSTEDYITILECGKNARLEGKKCVYYDIKDAKRS